MPARLEVGRHGLSILPSKVREKSQILYSASGRAAVVVLFVAARKNQNLRLNRKAGKDVFTLCACVRVCGRLLPFLGVCLPTAGLSLNPGLCALGSSLRFRRLPVFPARLLACPPSAFSRSAASLLAPFPPPAFWLPFRGRRRPFSQFALWPSALSASVPALAGDLGSSFGVPAPRSPPLLGRFPFSLVPGFL